MFHITADGEKILVPPLLGLPHFEVSLTTVANDPRHSRRKGLGIVDGGRLAVQTKSWPETAVSKRGWPFLPSSHSNNAVSSPQLKVPKPWWACSWKLNAAHDVVAQVTRGSRFFQRCFETFVDSENLPARTYPSQMPIAKRQ